MKFPDLKHEFCICIDCTQQVPRTSRTQKRCKPCTKIVEAERAVIRSIKRKEERRKANANTDIK